MKRLATIIVFLAMTTPVLAQNTEFVLDVPSTAEFKAAYPDGLQSGARAVSGPFDMDGDGFMEFLLTDYSGGGRVHVIENRGPDTWEHVYSTPWLDSTTTGSFNARYAHGTNASADLDGDGMGEIILPTGRRFSATNPNYAGQTGLYIFEYTGVDDNYGDAPATIVPVGSYPRIQTGMTVADIDGDGVNELVFANNGPSAEDIFYILSVTGDIGSGFDTWVQEFALNPRDNGNAYGGGSPEGAYVADLDGDGQVEVMWHSWNNYNFFPMQITGPDAYNAVAGNNLRATLGGVDAVAYAGGTVIDINGDGDDEIFLNNYDGSGSNPDEYRLTVINYESGEDISVITADQIKMGLLPDAFTWGVTSGDMDNDGNPEVLGVGSGYPGADAAAGTPARFVKAAEFIGGVGGDPEDPANYQVSWIETGHEAFRAGVSSVVSDSLGDVTTTYSGSGIFAFRGAYLGDADGDGYNEMALGFQGVPDSTTTLTRTWNGVSWDSVTVTSASTARAFGAVISTGADGVAREERIIVPSDYLLSANYPNPFNPTTSFNFTLPIDKTVSVKIYDAAGRLVTTLIDNQAYPAGTFEVQWDGTNAAGASVASGTYLYTLEYGNFRQARTMVLLK